MSRWLALMLTIGFALSTTSLARADLGGRYQQRNLVSDGSIAADHTDANLVNAWGIAFNPFGFVWVADNGTGAATLYDGPGMPQSLIVTIPGVGGAKGNPTGIVFSGSPSDFIVPKGATAGPKAGPARFIFATEDGVIAGWSPVANMTQALLVADNSPSGAVYKGLALSADGNRFLLYATDFHNNKIDVWDNNFDPVTLAAGAFTDPRLPAGFAPFGIQAINGNLFVTYAMQDEDRHDDVKGRGLGFVNVFDPSGKLIGRFASRGRLNAPWGVALAPSGFGVFEGRLLVGNFGDGRINAFSVATGQFLGQLRDVDGRPLEIDGLWGLAFGNGLNGQPINTLFFTAGPADETQGLYGRLDPLPFGSHE
jgi:uncharacterized protein (TIGR03118 family)